MSPVWHARIPNIRWKGENVDIRTVRELEILLPGDEPDGMDPMDGVPRDGTTVAGQIIEGDAWTRARFTGCNISRSWFVSADLSSIDLAETTLDRCVMRGCTLIGGHLTNCLLKNMIFENCRLDHATLTTTRTTGAVAMIGCSLTETTFDHCQLTTIAFDNCKLTATNFAACDMRGADLHNNDLSKTIGLTTSLRGATISELQITGLLEAITQELGLKVKGV